MGVVGLVAAWGYSLYLVEAHDIHRHFEGRPWQLPARVYARPLELFEGAAVDADEFAAELALLRYRPVSHPRAPGSFRRLDNTFEVVSRQFAFWDGLEPARRVRVRFEAGRVAGLESLDDEPLPGLWRIEPVQIAGIYPDHHEDRLLVRRDELPPVLVDALLAVEDRTFYHHFGIYPKGIVRAMLANLREGRVVQGGSTLTQQLVKNFFLTNERALRRKVEEVLLALYVDWHYDKDQILTAYANEVYLGQDGSRAIHGLALGSRFYFDRALDELNLHHVALLVGMISGPIRYDPRRQPEEARARRAVVLDVMAEQNLISSEDAAIAKGLPLDVSPEPPRGETPYPAFVDLVRRQLRQYYRDEDLKTEGLKVFSTLDPAVQAAAEAGIVEQLPRLEAQKGLTVGSLESAAIVSNTQTGDVLAVVGGRDVRLAGFNRALDAQRQPGSLLKAAIYLTALERPERYTLATLIDADQPIEYRTPDGRRWSPGNYSNRAQGRVTLARALAKSINIPAVRVGLDVDVLEVIQTLERLGFERPLEPYPSLLLGAADVTPFEMAELYETLASGGFQVALRAINEVTGPDGTPLERQYALRIHQAIEPEPSYLINYALQGVVESGTARRILGVPALKDKGLAGKTGTTNDYRDSWFAGYSGNLLTVVWVGRDDNKPMRLSGSSGALPVWMDIMAALDLEPLTLIPPPGIEERAVDLDSGLLADEGCGRRQVFPFVRGSAPWYYADCSTTRRAVPAPDPISSLDAPATAARGDDEETPGDDDVENFFRRLQRR